MGNIGRSIPYGSDVYFGDLCNVHWWCESSSYHFKLVFEMGSGANAFSYTTEMIHPGISSSYTYSAFRIPLSAAECIPNDVTGIMYITLYRYSDSSGSSLAGYPETATFKVTLRDDVVPKMNSVSSYVDNSLTPTISSWGVAVTGYSRIRLVGSGTGVYGSKIKSYSIECETLAEVTASTLDYTSDVIKNSGLKRLKVRCKDSRGRVSEEYLTDGIESLPYVAPVIDSLVISKSSDMKFVATAKWSHSSVNGKNSSAALLYYKTTDKEDWSLYGNINNNSPVELEDIVYNEMFSYTFRVVVTDAVGNSSIKDLFASVRQVLLNFKAGGTGLGIGKICESDAMEVAMPAKFFDDVSISDQALDDYVRAVQNQPHTNNQIVDLIYPVGSLYMSVVDKSPAALFGGSWTAIHDRFLLGAGGKYAVNAIGGEETHTLTINEIPRHKHWGTARFSYDQASGSHPSAISDGAKTNLPYSDETGGDGSHNNMPPYYAVYMWMRVA